MTQEKLNSPSKSLVSGLSQGFIGLRLDSEIVRPCPSLFRTIMGMNDVEVLRFLYSFLIFFNQFKHCGFSEQLIILDLMMVTKDFNIS